MKGIHGEMSQNCYNHDKVPIAMENNHANKI